MIRKKIQDPKLKTSCALVFHTFHIHQPYRVHLPANTYENKTKQTLIYLLKLKHEKISFSVKIFAPTCLLNLS